MSIRDLEQGKYLKKVGKKMGRAVIAERALAIAQQIIDNGSYKNAVAGIGRMVTLSKCVSADGYWGEKRDIGKYKEESDIELFDRFGEFPSAIIPVD